ncbi:hypothetical protein G3435_15700 [Pseudomonas sp. MAFF212428]|uniref:Uncharacterized protein n=1 Tax=Pseudomonas brassicae TaxID=2708063 RepID=A0A6B3NWZ7_9PSED|nr:hypothetical protein [Pseudomonas brassicae]NER61022.1 hypothetical protein [Pseudomonas brassicae]NER64137.1 hypothetical protein [Pseudomonas brassicae]
MLNASKTPLVIAAGPLVTVGLVFAVVGLSGQPAFGYTAVGLLIPGVVLLVTAFCSKKRRG